MRVFVVAVLGLVGGFVGGIVLAELVGIAGLALFGGVAELSFVRFLPFVLAAGGAVAAPAIDARARRTSTTQS
ncbi:MAG: hypothetical protein GEV09_11865 [Pseudonocardiaceae bacterium]|nr:hypothetical protein [Pseudonocardiaceae bacterium]